METVAQTASAKIARRLIPFLMLCYFVAYLDRVNLGFAALTFKPDLGISDAAFGLGAGIFFAGYFIFEVPSNIILEKVGARIWIARIMFTWGIASACMALVTGETSFYVVRFLLGAAEAGFFPGIILYLTYWYTAAERARMIGWFMVAIPLSSAIGSPLSGQILSNMAGVAGLKSWQWLFIIEAIPAIILSFVTYFYLTDRPATATWLTPAERKVTIDRMEMEVRNREAIRKYSLGEALLDPRILAMSLIYFGIVTGLYGLGFWLPQIVKAFGLTNLQTSLVVAIPYIFSALVMVPWTRNSDRTSERTWHIATAAFLGGAGLIAGAYLGDPILAMIALTFGSIGTFAALPTFWPLPTALLTGTAAAGGIALINAIGNVGGFVGPYLIGWIRDKDTAPALISSLGGLLGPNGSAWISRNFGDPALGTASIGGFLILAGLITIMVGHRSEMERPQVALAE